VVDLPAGHPQSPVSDTASGGRSRDVRPVQVPAVRSDGSESSWKRIECAS